MSTFIFISEWDFDRRNYILNNNFLMYLMKIIAETCHPD